MSDQPPPLPGDAFPPTPSVVFTEPPPVVLWLKIYLGLLGGIYAMLVVLGLFMLVMSAVAVASDGGDAVAPLLVMGVVYILMGTVLGGAYLLPLFLRPRPWVWVYAIVLLAISMTSICCIPAAIPLLIYWIKDETRLFYGMSP